jgi:hypothetical protein
MFIVPGDRPLHVSARIDPIDIDQVFPGQEVSLMFTTFNRRTRLKSRASCCACQRTPKPMR